MLQHHLLSVKCHTQKKLHVVVTTHVLSQVNSLLFFSTFLVRTQSLLFPSFL